jgi:hypothetical protein
LGVLASRLIADCELVEHVLLITADPVYLGKNNIGELVMRKRVIVAIVLCGGLSVALRAQDDEFFHSEPNVSAITHRTDGQTHVHLLQQRIEAMEEQLLREQGPAGWTFERSEDGRLSLP